MFAIPILTNDFVGITKPYIPCRIYTVYKVLLSISSVYLHCRCTDEVAGFLLSVALIGCCLRLGFPYQKLTMQVESRFDQSNTNHYLFVQQKVDPYNLGTQGKGAAAELNFIPSPFAAPLHPSRSLPCCLLNFAR